MRKDQGWKLAMVIVLAVVFCGGCNMSSDMSPSNFPGTVWVSDDQQIWFHVSAADEQSDMKGRLVTNNREYDTIIYFYHSSDIFFADVYSFEKNADGDDLLTGRCRFSRDRMVVNISDDDINEVLDPSIKRIVFNRFDTEERKDLIDDSAVAILTDGSYLEKHEIIGDKVYFYTHITLRNNTDSDQLVQLAGRFIACRDEGLLKDWYLRGIEQGSNDAVIMVNTNSVSTYQIVFCGEFAGKDIKVSRTLPYIYLYLMR
jgi:hypothetical protein